MIYMGLQLQQRVAESRQWVSLQRSGDYGDPPATRTFVHQLMGYMFIIMFSKVLRLRSHCAAPHWP